MRRLRLPFAALTALLLSSGLFAGNAMAISSRLTLDQAIASGWDCGPLVLIGGHFHCSPPGKEGVIEIIEGTADSASIVHTVFRPDGRFAGKTDREEILGTVELDEALSERRAWRNQDERGDRTCNPAHDAS